MLTDRKAEFCTMQICLHSNPLFVQASSNLFCIICRWFRNKAYHCMDRCQPGRQCSRVVLDQHPDETLEGTENCPMQHDWSTALIIGIDIFSAQACRHGEIHLNGSALPMTADRILQGVFDLRAVERALSW